MADQKLHTILQVLGLHNYVQNFKDENITSDIISMLSKEDFKSLGLTDNSTIMRLRIKCCSFGGESPGKVLTNGAPKFLIPKQVLENFLEDGCLIEEIANMLNISVRTIYRRMEDYGLSKHKFSEINEEDLDILLIRLVEEFPHCGEVMLRELLKERSIKITRQTLRDSLNRIDENGSLKMRKKKSLHRRVYSVQGPNHLWHLDTNHKLVRWNFIITGIVDGFSRLPVGLYCTNNNKALTILSCFQASVEEYGLPSRVRADKGKENVLVADYMIERRGVGRKSMITGKSTHNQRVERLWRDVYTGVLSYFSNIFTYLEDQDVLDSTNILHLTALHHVYLPFITEKLCRWRQAWSTHRLRTVNSTPQRLWVTAQMTNPIDIDPPVVDEFYGAEDNVVLNEEEQGDTRPIFEFDGLSLSEECLVELENMSLDQREDCGISQYYEAVRIIAQFHQIN